MIKTITSSLMGVALLASISIIINNCATSEGDNPNSLKARVESLDADIKRTQAEKDLVEARLKTFDELDFDVFSNQQWDRFGESHAHDIKVYWPDGRVTTGLPDHLTDLKAMFVYAPNTSIKEHPIKFGSGDWTCVIGTMTGTFSQPMPVGDGRLIQPNDSTFSISMCTVAKWNDSVMVEEHLFWDNHHLMKQLGLIETEPQRAER